MLNVINIYNFNSKPICWKYERAEHLTLSLCFSKKVISRNMTKKSCLWPSAEVPCNEACPEISWDDIKCKKSFHVRFEVFTAVTTKNAVFWDVAPCRSCMSGRFGGTYRLHLRGRKIREQGTSVSRWLQTGHQSKTPSYIRTGPGFPPPDDPIQALVRSLLPARPLYRPYPSPLYWFPMWPTLPPSLFLYSWVFSTGGSVCNHLLTLVPCSRIFLPWRWRRYVLPKRRFIQDLHGATSQKTAFFKSFHIWA
jgi:hypothetical protein